MGIFDVDENIENVSFDRIYKLKRLYDELSDGASLKGEQIIADTLKISYEFGETEWLGGKRSGYSPYMTLMSQIAEYMNKRIRRWKSSL